MQKFAGIDCLRTDNKAPRELHFRIVNSAEDLPALVSLAREAHEESRFSYIPFSEEKVRKIALAALETPNRNAVFLSLKGKRPIGFAYCTIGEYHIGEGALLTTIHNMNVSRSVRASLSGGKVALGLFKGVETWSKARGASEVLFHVTSGVDLARAHKLAKRIGFKFIGGSYARATKDA